MHIPDTIFIEEDNKLTDSLMPTIGRTRLICVKLSDVEKIVSISNNMILYRLFPLEYINKEFSVAFVPFTVTISKSDGLFLANSGSFWVFFDFYRGKFHFKRFGNYGI
jgi:hypothetical protein